MLPQTAFSIADAGIIQTLAFVGGAIFHIGFFVWVAYLAWK
ncbi:hypothetical protein [Sinorhizobium fredii]|uniref:Uncharacterized protein n=1 Tax=Sinorhizobium fredii (strain HH103) TaxID=1117943 RepID=G9AF85_SINF1|nr:hypothetical protein [Sinorhizobium fredii]ASY71617.1 hypothetical protein SF83666_b49680 [Sinorhizobium fredii CCBAU 83666]AWI60216.1 hypothetical protein AB395_00005039 [Sinorhizobium fredii CCBAU 45436]AWM29341.1 hypothetical protein AOX55_00006566 [Sinorhizobium fredii CCBAU 25509]KSV86202.1 hypothetical protein N181_22220 [Sinorhizobium fredii USDA 205]WOS65523.1 hypothetical protein SFGR64A_29025 [Sinorhizobium fredii GR64]